MRIKPVRKPAGRVASHHKRTLLILNSQYQVAEISSALTIRSADKAARALGLDRIFVLTVTEGTDIWEMAASYASDPYVEYAEPNLLMNFSEPPPTRNRIATAAAGPIFPNDPYFPEQDNLYVA